MGGGMGPAPLDAIVARLELCRFPLQVLVVAGHDRGIKRTLEQLRGKVTLDLHVFGWTDTIPQLMAVADLLITKPGGLTAAEALSAGLPMIVTHPIPGPEERHVQYLVQQGVAVEAETPDEIPQAVTKLLSKPESLAEMSRREKDLSRPDSAHAIAQVAQALLEKSTYIDLLATRPARAGESTQTDVNRPLSVVRGQLFPCGMVLCNGRLTTDDGQKTTDQGRFRMLSSLRKLFERTVIGESVPSLVRWGKYVPRALIEGIQRDSFRELVRYAAERQAFFKRKLQESGIEPSSVRRPEDPGDIFTTPEDLRDLPAEDFLCREPQLVFETTGTSGGPKRVYFDYDELEFTARYEAAAMWENGVRPGDRVVCTFDAGYWISGWVTFLAASAWEFSVRRSGSPIRANSIPACGL